MRKHNLRRCSELGEGTALPKMLVNRLGCRRTLLYLQPGKKAVGQTRAAMGTLSAACSPFAIARRGTPDDQVAWKAVRVEENTFLGLDAFWNGSPIFVAARHPGLQGQSLTPCTARGRKRPTTTYGRRGFFKEDNRSLYVGR